jgi:hypothetical protein
MDDTAGKACSTQAPAIGALRKIWICAGFPCQAREQGLVIRESTSRWWI